MKSKLKLRLAALAALLAGAGISANAQVWVGSQLGNPTYKGSITTNGSSLTILAGGNDIWGTSDNGYYYYTWAQGNWDARVNVASLDGGAADWRKIEMMVRWADPNVGIQGSDGFIAMMCAPGQGNGFGLQYRSARGKDANNVGGTDTVDAFPCWLRVTRTNQVFTVLSSTDGTTWVTNGTITTTATANGFGTAWPDTVAVGVAVTAHNDAAASFTTAVFSQPTIASSSPGWTAPTAEGIKTSPTDKTVGEGFEAAFTVAATNNAAPVGFPQQYQWYKNGSLAAGLTKSSIAFLPTIADSGSTYFCVAWPSGYPTLTATSAVATLTVNNSGTVTNGAMKLEVFAGSTRGDIYTGNVAPGDSGGGGIAGKLRFMTALEDPANDPLYGDNTSRRYSGWFVPAVNGSYSFYVAADDDTDVWLSPADANPANKLQICQEMGWSGYNNWTNPNGGGAAIYDPTNRYLIDQKCSNTWTNGLGVAPYPAGIPLIAGTRYYLEMDVHNGGGGDNASLTAQLFTAAPPTNGQPTELRGNVLQLITTQPTTLAWTAQPVSIVASEGQGASFRAIATSDSEFIPHYQWLREGTNVPGQTTTTFTIDPTQLIDSGSHIACVASVPMMNSITTTVATLTVQQAVFEPGFMLNMKWDGQNRAAVRDGTYTGTPLLTNAVPGMAAAIVSGEAGGNYTRKISGFFVPPATDRYHFYTTSDDQSDLYISLGNASQSANPANKTMIAQETGWSGVLNWTGQGGGGDATLKCSDTWKDASGGTPYSAGIQLTANQKYWMEVIQNEGGGGDNVAVTYRRDGDTTPANTIKAGDQPRMVGNVIGFPAPQCQSVWFTLEPTNPAPIVAGLNTATFYAFGDSDSKLVVGNITGDDSLAVANPQHVFFQWTRNNVPIPGATSTSYTTPWLTTNDNGAVYACQMRALGYGTPPSTRLWSNSTPATLTVVGDPTVPQIVYSGYWTDPNGSQFITLTFNTAMDTNKLADIANYTVGANVISVEVNKTDTRRVLLEVLGAVSFPLNISVSGLSSWSGVTMPPASAAVNPYTRLTKIDLGEQEWSTRHDSTSTFVGEDPRYPGKIWIDGTNALTIAAQGTDIWDDDDGFTFLYEQKAGNFDMVLRQTTYSLGNRWAKVGLMARDELRAGSRNWNIVNDPPNVPCLSDGNGANAVECNWRPFGAPFTNSYAAAGSTSTGWGNGTGMAPTYPNAWVRLKRAGNVLSAYAGSDGMNWTPLASMDVAANTALTNLPTSLYIGIAVTGHHNDPPQIPYSDQRFWNVASVDSYNSSYVAPPPQQTLTARLSGNNVIVSWTPAGGTLYSSPVATKDTTGWTAVGTANPATIPIGAGAMYFRVVTPYTP